jgi:hypothetical protein
MPGMELAQTKIPYLPPDWTIARGVRYAAKLGVFILVPGLHQIACRRWMFGGLLMALYFAAEFTWTNIPWDYADAGTSKFVLAGHFSDISLYISWILLAVDFRNIEGRKLKINFFLVLSCATGLYFAPDAKVGTLNIYIENDDFACPAWCKYDIVEYELRYLPKHKFSVGDYVIVEEPMRSLYVAKMMLDSPEEACAADSRTILRLPARNRYCFNVDGWYMYKYLALIGPHQGKKYRDLNGFTPLSILNIRGVELKKIGNTHEYFVLSDGLTDIVGHAMLFVYKITGINLFGLSK